MTISIIAAVAENRAIGKNNDLMWHISEDLKHFKNHTLNRCVLMGRKTFESFPVRPLPKRKNIIISRQKDYSYPNCIIVNTPEKAIEHCPTDKEIFICGGAAIYKYFLDKAHKMYLTHIHQSFDGDTFFPEFDPSHWEIIKQSERKTDPKNNLSYTFVEYIKKTAHKKP